VATPPDALGMAGPIPALEPAREPDPIAAHAAPPRPPRAGWRVVAAKEFGDGILSVRLFILIALLSLAAVGAVYSTATFVGQNAQLASGAEGLFVLLFSRQATGSQVPSFAALVGLLGPLLGIAFGFDAINGERSERTLPRLVAQPIHRDAVIIGKFAAGLAIIGMVLLAITLVVSGVAFLVLGIQPSPDDLARVGAWFVVTLAYLGFWLAFAMLCSVVVRRAATSALAAIALWIVLTIFTALLVGIVAGYLAPVPAGATLDQQIAHAELQLDLARVSPGTLYGEAAAYLLDPTVQTVGIVPIDQQIEQRAIPSILPLGQSLLLAWPQVVALGALTVVCFGAGYVAFMRQEVRA
jgi:ABC-2 type transport system permease protein